MTDHNGVPQDQTVYLYSNKDLLLKTYQTPTPYAKTYQRRGCILDPQERIPYLLTGSERTQASACSPWKESAGNGEQWEAGNLSGKQEIISEVWQNRNTSLQEIVTTRVNIAKQEMTAEITCKMDTTINKCDVHEEVQTQKHKARNAWMLCIGGLLDGWHAGNHVEQLKKIREAILQIEWDVPTNDYVIPKGTHALIMEDKTPRNKILKQSNKLRGINIWVSEELTPTELKMKVAELVKVKEACREGKWTVYRDGKAQKKTFKSQLFLYM